MSIKVLSKYMADLIAAGEVVERPAAAVKELVENALDSSANSITVEIENGGITYIRVSDNGVGIKRGEVELAFLRHATSKLSQEEDLDNISTLGFRGEALAAISSVSKINMVTKHDGIGTSIELVAGDTISINEVSANKGTTIIVRDLFYNIPARMKFLKKDFTEAGYITSICEKYAISFPDISFKYIKDKKVIFNTLGDGDELSAIYSVLGKEYTLDILKIKEQTIDGITIKGFVSKPKNTKSTRKSQIFFVNGRYVKNVLIQTALEQAYKNLIMSGKYPIAILHINIDFNKVDVNVHPTKLEIKFSEEKKVFSAVYVAVKNTITETVPSAHLNEVAKKNDINLGNNPAKDDINSILDNKTPKYEKMENMSINDILHASNENASFRQDLIREIPVHNYMSYKKPYIEFTESNDYGTQNINDTIENNYIKTQNKEILNTINNKTLIASIENIEPIEENNIKFIGECFGTYILVQKDDKLILIDKHAAHERIIFNKIENTKMHSQLLLEAEVLNCSIDDFSIISENINEIREIGFDIEIFGEKSFAIREIPAYITLDDIENVLTNIEKSGDILDNLKHSIACRGAIKAGHNSSDYELEILAKEVLSDKKLQFCPHGRPIVANFDKYAIEKMFKRVV